MQRHAQGICEHPGPQLLLLQNSGRGDRRSDSVEGCIVDPGSLARSVAEERAVRCCAQAKLVALGSIPLADSAVLASAQKAAGDSPKQWRTTSGFAVGGEIVFIPLIWLLHRLLEPEAGQEGGRGPRALGKGRAREVAGVGRLGKRVWTVRSYAT